MKKKDSRIILKASVVITYIGMIAVNILANILPINGVKTGQVSDSYPNLFAPAGVTFIIWGLIYILLACYSLYQLDIFRKFTSNITGDSHNKIRILFSISSLANIFWIFSWHYHLIFLSLLLMLAILICLILINVIIRKHSLTTSEKAFVSIPFGVYLGWITVATIANVTTFLVSINWTGFGISEQLWTILIIIIGMLIAILTIINNRNIPYGIVIIWAYSGILIKHLSKKGFGFQYPGIVYTVIICIVLIIITLAYVIGKKEKN